MEFSSRTFGKKRGYIWMSISGAVTWVGLGRGYIWAVVRLQQRSLPPTTDMALPRWPTLGQAGRVFTPPITDYFLDTNYPLEGSSFQLRGILGEAPTQQQEEWMPQTWGGDLGHTIASTTYLNQILKLDCIACSSEERRLKQSQKIAESSDEAILKITFSFSFKKVKVEQIIWRQPGVQKFPFWL